MKAIELTNIGKQFNLPTVSGTFWALKNISFDIDKGKIVGIIGRNGAGKTTLLNIIAGLLQPTEGNLRIIGKALGLFTLGAGFRPELSGRENIFLNGSLLGMSDFEIKRKYRDIVDFSELDDFINMPLGSYSQGMRMRLGFSIATQVDFNILIIDEVLLVGDGAFQKRCFEKLKDFRRESKTMLITTQSLDLIERLCDKVFLLENGRLEDGCEPARIIDAYRKILNEDRKKLRSLDSSLVVRKTKWWAEDRDEWGRREGTKEVVIESVKITNRWGLKTQQFNTGDKAVVKVSFSARDTVQEPHFGIALFRDDGVYCYGANTPFDSYTIDYIHNGRGWFRFEYKKLLLMPGVYYLSVAIWDKKEVLAYDYHKAYYKVEIRGSNKNKQLLYLPSYWKRYTIFAKQQGISNNNINIFKLKDRWLKKVEGNEIDIQSVEFLDKEGNSKNSFLTGEKMRIRLGLKNISQNKNLYIWSGIFRQDSVFCHGTSTKIAPSDNVIYLTYPRFYLLPGEYRLSVGLWDRQRNAFLTCHHGIYPFQVFFNRQDHGTVYLEHKWNWKVSEERNGKNKKAFS